MRIDGLIFITCDQGYQLSIEQDEKEYQGNKICYSLKSYNTFYEK